MMVKTWNKLQAEVKVRKGMKVFILADFKIKPESGFWLKEELDRLGYLTGLKGIADYNPKDEETNFGKMKIWVKYFRLAIAGIRETGKNDVIITDNFVIGAIVGFLCKISGIRRKIIALNMIAHHKGILNRIFRKIVYNTAFRNKSFWFSVNDKELIAAYSKQFRISEQRIFILHDPFYKQDEQQDYQEAGDFIFTGGDAFRDWHSVIKCSELMPEIRFIGVARKKNFPVESRLPGNLKMYYDIPSGDFYGLLKKCRIVFLPLNSLAPCGLIVMMKAALLSKPIIITETPATKNYIENNISGKLVKINDLAGMQDSIRNLYRSEELRRKYSASLKQYILNNYSTEKCAKVINDVIMN